MEHQAGTTGAKLVGRAMVFRCSSFLFKIALTRRLTLIIDSATTTAAGAKLLPVGGFASFDHSMLSCSVNSLLVHTA